ncbi:hypothetical protein [Rhodococcus sp. T7]|uniref:hypothetical protein n=1 Tax=Rhodococcus sp. T7 TaxID=627444 RepID=UPI00135C6029|nr:hypothetical protein [Rhodococcus sp. T7]KAF0957289.1 hypothetical protein MLGJGCBP_09119 [Rhodococcus sp. T7]KAF0965124.1 hypothetical protein MLGJGCBP_01724 [Rhodococcus sp. T7]
MNKMSVGILSSFAAGIVLTGCGGEEESVDEKVARACTDTMLQEKPIGPSGPGVAGTADYLDAWEATFLDMTFADVTARSDGAAGVTETWTVQGTGTAQWEKKISSTVWDDDGKPDPLPPVTEKFSCEVGYRSSDEAVVVFEYTTYHPTSGGSQSKILVQREGAGG